VTAFPDTLHRLVLRGIGEMGFKAPTPIQASFIPAALAPAEDGDALRSRDLVGLAPTGTGKTLAYGIPLADLLLRHKPVETGGRRRDPRTRLRALVLVPTRELAQQVAEEIRHLVRGSLLRVTAVYGKVAIAPQAEALKKGVDIVVATPGRARELIEADVMTLAHLLYVVCDEADRMLDMGFLPQVDWVLSRAPEGRAKWLLSATLPRQVEDLVHKKLAKPEKISVGTRNAAAAHLALLSARFDAAKRALDELEAAKAAAREAQDIALTTSTCSCGLRWARTRSRPTTRTARRTCWAARPRWSGSTPSSRRPTSSRP
jgi:superfamily II DNA/RNA helicase